MPPRQPDTVRLVLLAAAGLAGLVWMLQGLGVAIGGSFMVGDPKWTAIGGGLLVVAIALAWREARPRRG